MNVFVKISFNGPLSAMSNRNKELHRYCCAGMRRFNGPLSAMSNRNAGSAGLPLLVEPVSMAPCRPCQIAT